MRLRLVRYVILVLACMVSSLDHARAGIKDSTLEKAFFAQLSEFYDYTGDNRGMIPFTVLDSKNQPVEYMGGDALIVLHFWATWCPPCVKELPKLDRFARDFEGRGVRVVPVSLDYGMFPPELSEFMKKNGVETLPVLRVGTADPAWESLRKFALPTTFLIHPDGRVLYKLVGDLDWTSAPSTEFLSHLLAVTLN
jgi:thiol-disulfide isomerase/thioredoxin